MQSTSNGSEQAAQKLRQYTHRALTCRGDNSAYNEFLKEFGKLRKRNEREPSEASKLMLANLILALRDCVSVIKERTHDKILAEVLGLRLWSAAKIVQEAVVELITSLVVANAAFTHTCLQVLVFGFLPPPGAPVFGFDFDGNGVWQPTEDAVASQDVVTGAVHKVLALVPTAPTHLLPLVVKHLPFKLRDRSTQCLYLKAVFSIAEAKSGAPIRDALLSSVVEHLLGLDVEIRWEDIVDVPTGEEEEEGDTESEEEPDIFELEGMNVADPSATPEEIEQRQQMMELQRQEKQQAGRGGWEGAPSSTGNGGDAAAEASTSGEPRQVDLAANKLDSMMELTFQHLANRCLAADNNMQLWDTLISIFDRCILNTHRSKFTQFLIFFICMQQPKLYGRAFIDFLLTRLQDARHPAICRSACAAYLASFLARAAFVPETMVVHALSRLADFCHEYAKSSSASGADIAKASGAGQARQGMSSAAGSLSMTATHQVFYASIQALLYVLCYHLEPLMGAVAGEGNYAKGGTASTLGPKALLQAKTVATLVRERISPLLAHPRLCPLNVCLPSVVTEFKHQASSLGLLDLSTLVPSDDALLRSQRPLEMFFPFDPYLLQRSSRFLDLKSSYVRWKQGHPRSAAGTDAGTNPGSDDESSDGSSDEEEDQNVDELDDELDGLSLDGDEAGDGSETSSSESESESGDRLGAGLLPLDDVLTRQALGASRGRRKGIRDGLPPRGQFRSAPDMMMRNGRGLYAGCKHGRSVDDDGRSMLMAVMGASYSPINSSMGDMTPTGTSPVLVDYAFPGSLTARSPSGMSMSLSVTPPSVPLRTAVPQSCIGAELRKQ